MVGYVNSICERILDALENGLIDCTSEITRAKVRVVRVAVQALKSLLRISPMKIESKLDANMAQHE